MSNITIRRAGELLRCVFEILWDKPDGLTARDVLSRIPQVVKLNQEELNLSPVTNTPNYEKIVRIASIPVTEVGWLAKSERGLWRITPIGYEACSRFANVQDFYLSALHLYNERRRLAPEHRMTLELAQEASWAQINRYLFSLNPNELQMMLAELLRAMEYYPAWVAPPEKQHGKIDLIAYADPIGARGKRILAQIIQKGQPVTLEGVKSFASVLGQDDFGMILSIGGFTSEAIQELDQIRLQKVTALDAFSFFNLWETYYDDLKEETHRLLPLKAVNFLNSDQ